MPRNADRMTGFELKKGDVLAGAYVVDRLLGGGWEGEVYRVRERRSGGTRAAKLFFPHRNERNRAVRYHARKLERLRRCDVLVRYHHSEEIDLPVGRVTALISEYVEGVVLERAIAQLPRKRMPVYEAMMLTYWLARGLEHVHDMGEYHGDLHTGNILVRRFGVKWDVKLIDFYSWGRPSKANRMEDVFNLVRVFYDAIGGPEGYREAPPEAREIARGLRRDLIMERFPTVRRLRQHLEAADWSGPWAVPHHDLTTPARTRTTGRTYR
jgi:tRNA A-37 threonylcarbamoyl transferase component Bud32